MLIRKEGLPCIGISALLSYFLSKTFLRFLGWIPVGFVTWFFRDPRRTGPTDKGVILSPADGRVIESGDGYDRHLGECRKVSIFMSIFNVHVNRAPVEGEVIEKYYKPGEFHLAFIGKKTELNERMVLYIKNKAGLFRVDQVAGFVARRIVCWPDIGDRLSAGERIGLIHFGSLLECYIPKDASLIVKKGDTVYAGKTMLGRYLV